MNSEIDMRAKVRLLVCVIVLAGPALSGCAKSEFEVLQDKHVGALAWVLRADPDRDFEAAISSKDYRFIGVYGINNPVPGVPRSCIDGEQDVRYLAGTSEVSFGYEHEKLNAVARVYAGYFNHLMLRYHESEFGRRCSY